MFSGPWAFYLVVKCTAQIVQMSSLWICRKLFVANSSIAGRQMISLLALFGQCCATELPDIPTFSGRVSILLSWPALARCPMKSPETAGR